jgi:hypothetical protein
MITNPFQRKAYEAVSAALPFAVDPAKITVEPGVSYLPSPIKLHDYAAGVMAAFGSVVEHLGRVRGLPAQTMTLNRRLAGFHLNELQVQLLNGYSLMRDTWPMGARRGAAADRVNAEQRRRVFRVDGRVPTMTCTAATVQQTVDRTPRGAFNRPF